MLHIVLARHLASAGLLSTLLLAGCATAPITSPIAPPVATPEQDAATSTASDDTAVDQTAPTTKEEEAAYPKQALTPELLMGFLVGDFAAQRGDKQLAADAWIELAQRTKDPRAAERALELAVQTGYYDRMLAAAKLWRESAPQSVQARYSYIVILASGKQLPQAEKELAQWINDDKEAAPAIMLDLHTMLSKYPDKRAALAMTHRLADSHTEMPEAAMAVSLAAEDADDIDAAIVAADEAIRRRPDWISAITFRAELTEKSAPEESLRFLKKTSENQPHSQPIKALLARMESAVGDYEASLRLYKELESASPKEIEYPVGEALADMQLRQLNDAKGALKRALALNPKHPGILHYHLGVIAEEQGQLDTARQEYEQVDDPNYGVQTASRLAHVEAKSGNKDAAFAQLAHIPADTPTDQVSHLQLEAQIWSDLKDFQRARSVLDEGLAKHADNADLLYDRSLIFDHLGDIAGAERDLRRFLALNPDSAIGLNALGYTLANRTDRLDEAEQLIRKALNAEPNNPIIQDSFGWLLVRKGKFDEGSQWLGKAFALMPDPEIAAHYGEALWRIGKQSEARKIWNEGAKIDPNQEVLSETIHRLTGK